MSSNLQLMAASLCEILLEGLIEVLISPGFLFFYVIQVEAHFQYMEVSSKWGCPYIYIYIHVYMYIYIYTHARHLRHSEVSGIEVDSEVFQKWSIVSQHLRRSFWSCRVKIDPFHEKFFHVCLQSLVGFESEVQLILDIRIIGTGRIHEHLRKIFGENSEKTSNE